MSEAKFTKGQWIADIRGGCCAVYEKSREEDTPGMGCDDERNIYYSSMKATYNGHHWHMSEEAIANAHLIAAAPEMYEMLEEMIKQFEYDGCTEYEFRLIQGAKDLLSKARGEA